MVLLLFDRLDITLRRVRQCEWFFSVSWSHGCCFFPLRPEQNPSLPLSLCRGFCYFNSVAIAAKLLQQRLSVRKILIVDWVSSTEGTLLGHLPPERERERERDGLFMSRYDRPSSATSPSGHDLSQKSLRGLFHFLSVCFGGLQVHGADI